MFKFLLIIAGAVMMENGIPDKPAADTNKPVTIPMSVTEWQSHDKDKFNIAFDEQGRGTATLVTADGKPLHILRIDDQTLVIDRNANGVRDEGDEVVVNRTVKADLLVAGRPVPHEFTVEGMSPKEGARLSPRNCLYGKAGDLSVAIYDGNFNGTYGDLGEDLIQLGNAESPRLPFSKMAVVNGMLMDIKFDGKSITLSPSSAETVSVGLDASLAEKTEAGSFGLLVLHNEKLGFSLQLDSGAEVNIPKGTYQITEARIWRKIDGRECGFMGRKLDASIEVGGDKALHMGNPAGIDAAVEKSNDDELSVKNPRIIGAAGEAYLPRYQGTSFTESGNYNPEIVMRLPDGTEKSIAKMVPG